MKTISLVISFTCLIVLFQNCANDKVEFSETASISLPEPETFNDDEAAPAIPASSPTAQAATCFQSGHIFTTGNGEPVIYYHKCDGEIEAWRKMGESQCCSKKVDIVDLESYDYPTCPRFQGRMTCQ